VQLFFSLMIIQLCLLYSSFFVNYGDMVMEVKLCFWNSVGVVYDRFILFSTSFSRDFEINGKILIEE